LAKNRRLETLSGLCGENRLQKLGAKAGGFPREISQKYRANSVAKRHRMPYLYKFVFEKERYGWWLFCGKRYATEGI